MSSVMRASDEARGSQAGSAEPVSENNYKRRHGEIREGMASMGFNHTYIGTVVDAEGVALEHCRTHNKWPQARNINPGEAREFLDRECAASNNYLSRQMTQEDKAILWNEAPQGETIRDKVIRTMEYIRTYGDETQGQRSMAAVKTLSNGSVFRKNMSKEMMEQELNLRYLAKAEASMELTMFYSMLLNSMGESHFIDATTVVYMLRRTRTANYQWKTFKQELISLVQLGESAQAQGSAQVQGSSMATSQEIKCYNCQGIGHMARQCPSSGGGAAERGAQEGNRGDRGGRARGGFRGGRGGGNRSSGSGERDDASS